ncbi:MAG TPA: UbiA-like polyprenyltransferase [Salinivirgaceae bacterium]|nr:UbiA-like polyprenyltransferase [Salinivirgaceae bacterium]
MRKLAHYLSLVKFSHTLFAMPFALTGFFVATHHYGYPFDLKLLLLVIFCMITARNAAMSFNRYIDREWDKKNQRTTRREIPAGIISPKNALVFAISNAVLFVFITFFINRLCFYLSPIALLIILGYSYTKRFTPYSHFILGIGLGIAPVGAFLAVAGQFHLLPVILSFAVWAWVSGFDIVYALQDEEFDRNNKLFSIPAMVGTQKALWLARLMHVISATLIAIFTIGVGINWQLTFSAIIFVALLIYQHIKIKSDDLSNINFVFFTINGFASLMYAIFAIWGLCIK